MSEKKIQIIDIDTACALLGCNRAHIYNNYLKNKILSPVPRVGKKAYFYYEEVSNILDKELANVAARKNLKLTEANLDNYKLLTEEFKNNYTELTHKN
jgi:predicted DNA-binding transcriptional regulator AlpA